MSEKIINLSAEREKRKLTLNDLFDNMQHAAECSYEIKQAVLIVQNLDGSVDTYAQPFDNFANAVGILHIASATIIDFARDEEN